MADIGQNEVIGQIVAVLREAFEGPAAQWSYFTDNDPEAGLLSTLRGLTAKEASRTTGDGTIASHVHHMCYALEASRAWIVGDRSPRNWAESWVVSTVEEDRWPGLVDELEGGYQALAETIRDGAMASKEAMGAAIAAVAHAAYHLGSVQQKLLFRGRRRGKRG